MLMKLKGIYNFKLYPSSVIAPELNNAKVIAIMDGDTASQFFDLAAVHVSVKPYLPPSTDTDPFQYTYLRLQTEVGGETFIAYEWIDPSTITAITNDTCEIVLSNFNASHIPGLRQVLLENGFTNIVSIKIRS